MSEREPGAARYPHLFSPFRLGRLVLPNRLVVPGLTTNFGDADGEVTDALCRYLAERARGGYGLIVTENIGIAPSGRVMPRMIMADKDRRVRGLSKLAKAVHREGGLVLAQLSHAGRQTKSRITGMPLVAPSAIPCPINREMPRELTPDEIRHYERRFVEAAVRVAVAGFDGVEIHAAHGYLAAGFLSAYSNRRDDDYGGPLQNRMRFLLNIISGIREKLGEDFPLAVRISGCEFVEGGLDVPEAVEIGRALAARGVHALSVSVGVYESFNKLSMVSGEPEGQWLHIMGAVRQRVPLPVIGVGRIKRAAVAERALREGRIDLAAFGRASIADAELPRKIRSGHEPDILSCMGCNLCLGRTARPETICPVNPAVGREAAFDFKPSSRPKRLTLLGGSFSALTAAWIAAARGHRVVLSAPENEIGGLQQLRARVPGQAEIAETGRALRRRAEAAGVIFADRLPDRKDTDVTWAVRRFVPTLPPPATDLPVLAAIDVHAGRAGGEVERAIVFGDDLCAAEAAVLLADRGIKVELRTPVRLIAIDAHPGFRDVVGRALAERGAVITTNAPAPVDRSAGAADLLVLGRDPSIAYEDERGWLAPAVLLSADALLGDAYEPGLMARTIYEAAALAIAL